MTATSTFPFQFDVFRDDDAEFRATSRSRNVRRLATEHVAAAPPDDSADRAVLLRLCAGDETALHAIFDQHLHALIHFAEAMLGAHGQSSSEAGDIVSHVLITLWDRRATLDRVLNLRAYLYQAVRYRALSHRRSERRAAARAASLSAYGEQPGMSAEPMPADRQLEALEQQRIVWQAVQDMREPLRTVAVLRWSHGLGFAEIGAILDISASAARVHASRALAILRKSLPDLLV